MPPCSNLGPLAGVSAGSGPGQGSWSEVMDILTRARILARGIDILARELGHLPKGQEGGGAHSSGAAIMWCLKPRLPNRLGSSQPVGKFVLGRYPLACAHRINCHGAMTVRICWRLIAIATSGVAGLSSSLVARWGVFATLVDLLPEIRSTFNATVL